MPQEGVCGGQFVELAAADVALVMKLLQRKQSSAGTQPGLGSAVNALQALNQEFDIANSSAIDLHINGLLGSRSLATPAINFLPAQQGGFNGGEIDLLSVNLRLNLADKFACQTLVACGIADLDERLPLPIMRGCGVIVEGLGQTNRQLALVSLRPQSQVNSKYRTFAGRTRQDLGNLLRQTNKIFAVGNGRGRRLATIAEQKQQIDVGTVVELVPAKFSQGKNGKRRTNGAILRIEMLGKAEAAFHVALSFAQSLLDQDIAERGNLRRCFG